MLAKIFSYLVMALAIILLIIAGAFAVGYRLGENSGWQKAAVKVSQSNPIFSEPAETKTVVGQIKTIEEDSLTVETWPTTFNPLISGQKLLRKIIIDENTGISRQRMKTGAEMKAEISKEMPPSPLILEPIKKEELKVGDKVAVSADENIKDKKEFVATAVVLMNI